jgi:flagellar protein FliS
MTPDALRVRYLTEAIETATPAGRLTLLLDALEMDLARVDRAFAAGAPPKETGDLLVHAQEILAALRDTIDVSAWDPAERIRALYHYLYTELVQANLDKDRARAAAVAAHVSQLAAAWREAARRSDPVPATASVA